MANNYDRIFKENIEALLLPLLKKVLGLNPPKLLPIDAKLQVTQEAEMDNIRRVVHDDPALDYGLQIEFHIADEDLRKRNLLHHALFHSITGLPLRQIVIYGGKSDPRHIIQNHLFTQGLELSFEVLVLKQIPKELFTRSKVPEEVVLAILCDFGKDQPEQVVQQILQHLHKICRSPNRIKKYQKQLLTLSRLRKMEIIVKSQVEAMTIHYDIETDGLFLQGIELKEREFIRNLWLLQEFPLEKIALLSGTSLERVIEVLSAHLQSEGLSEAVAAQTLEAYQTKVV
ncbi:MAG: hypothetical protein SFV55_15480 [Haliscomenobacter sp.]|uniref:hypothetical protein n=1 Tax=Haliscomenobacter sp. TaxID=2717303 RepID=UPI0029A6B7ED|nr:hypothetical protein [Haliscomenobacter sp.]MDX2069829.1 hypothetical protein [Haliscomenobacter sp.]